MSLNHSLLENLKTCPDGKTTARCPACKAMGADTKGEHLVIFPDGKFGCVTYPRDKAHNKEIFRLAGVHDEQPPTGRLKIQTVHVPPSSVLIDLGGFDRFTRSRTRNRNVEKNQSLNPEKAEPKPEQSTVLTNEQDVLAEELEEMIRGFNW